MNAHVHEPHHAAQDVHASVRAYRFGKGAILAAAALMGAMVADLAEMVLDPASSGDAAQLYDAAVGHHGRLVLSGYLLLVSALLVFPGVFGLARGVIGRGRRLAKGAMAVAFLGALGHATLATAYLICAAIPGGSSGQSEMVAAIDRVQTSAAVAPLAIGFIAFPVSILLLFGALLRSGIAPRWVLAPVVAAPLSEVVMPGPDYLSTVVALALLLLAAAAVTVRIARRELPSAKPAGSGAVRPSPVTTPAPAVSATP
jgi:hypothetical protein